MLTVLRPGADSAPVLAGMVGDADAAYVVAPERAAWLSPLVRTRHGYALTPDALLVRGGRVRRFVDVVPHARIQSLRLRQGPVQRRLRLATVEILSTPGTAEPRVAAPLRRRCLGPAQRAGAAIQPGPTARAVAHQAGRYAGSEGILPNRLRKPPLT